MMEHARTVESPLINANDVQFLKQAYVCYKGKGFVLDNTSRAECSFKSTTKLLQTHTRTRFPKRETHHFSRSQNEQSLITFRERARARAQANARVN